MAKPLDYSIWDKIEISDDEDDTHPNVDTPSLFRWRHQARLDRMAESAKEKEQVKESHAQVQSKMLEMKQKLKEAEEKEAADELEKLKLELANIQKQEEDYRKKEEELLQKEKHAAWNIDTICHEGKTKTIVNKYDKPAQPTLSEDERLDRQQEFTKKNEKLLKKFGMLRKFEDSKEFLLQHPELTCEETANYLVIWCINLEVEEKHDLMKHVAHQTIVMQFILELAKSLKVDPRTCVGAFFKRIQTAEKQYLDAFQDELNSFKERIRGRAQARIDAAMREVEEEERNKRLGPGGLDPVEVFESLPKELQECFEKRDTELLQKVMASLPKEEAEYHLKRCIDSGMWVANAADQQQSGAENDYDSLQDVKSAGKA